MAVKNATAYSVALRDGMRVKHGTQVRFQVLSGRRVLEDRLTDIASIGGAVTVASFTYNGLTMSGGTAWRHPITGEGLQRPRVQMRVRNQDVLRDNQECDCAKCTA